MFSGSTLCFETALPYVQVTNSITHYADLEGSHFVSWPERIWSPRTLFQTSNYVGHRFGCVDPAAVIQIYVYRTSPFRRDVDAPLETLVSPPIEHHEEVLIREYVAELNG